VTNGLCVPLYDVSERVELVIAINIKHTYKITDNIDFQWNDLSVFEPFDHLIKDDSLTSRGY